MLLHRCWLCIICKLKFEKTSIIIFHLKLCKQPNSESKLDLKISPSTVARDCFLTTKFCYISSIFSKQVIKKEIIVNCKLGTTMIAVGSKRRIKTIKEKYSAIDVQRCPVGMLKKAFSVEYKIPENTLSTWKRS